MGRVIGYIREGAAGDGEAQRASLLASGCGEFVEENVFDATLRNLPQLRKAVEAMAEGDVLVVTRIDRPAGTVDALRGLVADLGSRGATLRALDHPFDTATAAGAVIAQLLEPLAEMEAAAVFTAKQAEGIAKSKGEGKYRGRPTIPEETKRRALELDQQKVKRKDIADQLGISRAQLYRILPAKEGEPA